MDNPTVKLLTNYHGIANVSPIPTVILREKKLNKSHFLHTHLESQVATKRALNKRGKQKHHSPDPLVLVLILCTVEHAEIWKENPDFWTINSHV